MLDNYLRVAWRQIAGNPLFSAINVIGLAIGLASCIVITLFVRYELSYDKHWDNADRTHRVVRDFYGNNLRLAAVAPPIGPLLLEDFPEVEDQLRLLVPGQINLTVDGQPRMEEHIAVADTHAIEFLGLKVLEGDRDTALASPTSLVMTRRGAERYFGSDPAVGKTLQLMGRMELTVTAVIEDLPPNTHMSFEMLSSITAVPLLLGEDQLENWGSNNYYTYLRLRPDASPEALEERFPAFLTKHLGENANQGTGLELQAIGDIHLHSNRDAEWQANGSVNTVYTFSAVALFVLLIACINFMNLTTALSTQRAKEVGVRKVVGATRGQLIAQFLGESILLTSLAMLLAVALVELTLPLFASFVERPLEIDLMSLDAALALVGGTLLVGVLAGSYPALFLSQFRPAQVLKGRDAANGSGLLRRVLVVFQFATSIALLVATGVVMLQMQYARNLDLGYDKSRNLITGLPFFADLWEVYEPMKQALEAHPDIESVVYSSRVPGMQNLDGSGYVGPDVQFSPENIMAIADLKVDYGWFEHYDIEFLAGGSFLESQRRIDAPTPENPVSRGGAVLNESAARRFGWSPEQAVGQVIRTPANRELSMFVEREVMGVIPDIHFSSLHHEIKATVFAEPNPGYGRSLSVKIAPGDPAAAIAHFEEVWRRLLPINPPEWEFLDQRFDALYRGEERQAQMFATFSGLAIFVATLGLFGLAAFTTDRRTKEIGVRKVMGAGVADIVLLLTGDFSRLVLLANLIAWPVAWVFMNDWLTRFVYRLPTADWAWLFIASGVAALVVATLTVALQAAKAAMARPVLALRYE